MEENKKRVEVDMKMHKKKNPIVIWILIALLIGVIGYTSVSLYNYLDLSNNSSKEEEQVDLSGYLSVDTEMPEDSSEKFEKFVEDNIDKKGAYLYQDKKHTYIVVSAGKIKDETGYTVRVESPVIDEEKETAKIIYTFIPYAIDEHQEDAEPEIMVLKLKKLKDVTMIETKEDIILE